MSFFQWGGGGLKVQITLTSNGNESKGGVVPLDHPPTWKIRKNPFISLRYPNRNTKNPNAQQQQASVHPTTTDDNVSMISEITAPTMMSRHAGGAAGGDGLSYRPDAMGGNSQYGTVAPMGGTAAYAYDAAEDVAGVVTLILPPGKKADHLGVKVQFIGRIDMGNTVHEGRPHYDFIQLSKELLPPGALYQPTVTIPFLFRGVEKQHETYRGRNVSVRYFIRVLLERKFLPPIQKEHDVFVQIRGTEPEVNEPIKMEVGIEDCLHIEFEYQKRCYHLNDVILGKINFLLVRIKIKHMELAVIRRETSGEGVAISAAQQQQQQQHQLPPGAQQQQQQRPSDNNATAANILTETQTLTKYEIMDGAPVKGETIPVRLFLGGIPADLTPTFDAVNNRFTVRYFLNLVLVDQEDRRYFKQQEIILWRKDLG